MIYPVRVFDAEGNLKEEIGSEELTRRVFAKKPDVKEGLMMYRRHTLEKQNDPRAQYNAKTDRSAKRDGDHNLPLVLKK